MSRVPAQLLLKACLFIQQHFLSPSRPGFGLDTGKTNEGNPNGWPCKWPVPTVTVEVCGSVTEYWVGCGPGSGTLAGQSPYPSDQGGTDWQQHEAEPAVPSAHSLEAQASLTAAPSAPAPWTSPDEAPWWANTDGAVGLQSLHRALPPPPALRMGLLLAPPVSPRDPCLFCSISG